MINTNQILETAGALLIISGALFIMGFAIEKMGSIGWEELVRGLIGIGGVLLMFVGVTKLAGPNAGLVATAILTFSVAMIALAIALRILGELSWDQLGIAFAAIGGFLVIIAIAGYLMAPIIPVLVTLGFALALIGLAALLFGAGVFLAATAIISLAGSIYLIKDAITPLGQAILELAPIVAEAIVLFISTLFTTLAEHIPDIVEAGKTILLTLIEGYTTAIPEIAGMVLDMIQALLDEIVLHLPDLIQSGYDILLAFIQGFTDNIDDIVKAGLDTMTAFLEGIEDGIPDLVDQVFSLVLTFMEAIEDATEEYSEEILDAAFGIGLKLIEGVTQSLEDNIPLLKTAVIGLIETVIKEMGLGFLLRSPSKVMYDLGTLVVLGFINSINDGAEAVKEAFTEFGRKAQNGIAPLIKVMSDEIDAGLEFAPVISPVLDLDNVNYGIGQLDRALPNSKLLGRVAYEDGRYKLDQSDPRFGPGYNQEGVVFYQYNYSPKALDRDAIYRQTKTQVARLYNRRFENV